MNNGVQVVVHFEQPVNCRNTGGFILAKDDEHELEQACSERNIIGLNKF